MSRKNKAEKQKKNSHTLYALTVITLGIAIIVVSTLLLFHVQTIQIAGNRYVSTSEIADCIRSDKNTKNSLYLMGKSLAGKIEFPKAVRSARVRMTAPWSIRVTVEEKKIAGYTIVGDEYVYFDEEGMVLCKSVVLMDGIRQIEGMNIKKAELYQMLPAEKRLFRNLREASRSFENHGIVPDRIVVHGAEVNIYLGKVYVQLGSGSMELKIAQIPPILAELDGKSGTLDLQHYREISEMISFKEGELPKTGKK